MKTAAAYIVLCLASRQRAIGGLKTDSENPKIFRIRSRSRQHIHAHASVGTNLAQLGLCVAVPQPIVLMNETEVVYNASRKPTCSASRCLLGVV